MARQFVTIALLVLAVQLSPAALAQGAGAKASAASSSDQDVTKALSAAAKGVPSANEPPPGDTRLATLDAYQQERAKIKLEKLVPYTLGVTPIILVIALVAMRLTGAKAPEHTMLAVALVLVIQATLIVSMTAEGSDALSASMGILGAIAGYLFGRARHEPTTDGDATAGGKR
jgi:hypothetical protein